MKNNKTFIKKWKLNGLPYLPAELQDEYLCKKMEEEAEVWLTDDSDTARQLLMEGACCIYLLTAENRNDFGTGIEWCAEVPEDVEEGRNDSDCGTREMLPEVSGAVEDWRGQLLTAEIAGLPDWLPEDFLWRVWLRSRNLPWHICETDRLVLREMTETDLDFLYEMQEDEEAARFLDALDSDRDAQRQKLAAYRQQMFGFYGFGIWIVLEKESGKPVGRVGLQMREGFEEPELGFAVLKKYRGRGYAEEACRAVLDYAKKELELKEIRVVVDRENRKSRNLCEKLGFIVDNVRKMDSREWIFYSRSLVGKDNLNSEPVFEIGDEGEWDSRSGKGAALHEDQSE